MALISAKFVADLTNISKLISRKTKWPALLALTLRWREFVHAVSPSAA